jgi:hypothetical protein
MSPTTRAGTSPVGAAAAATIGRASTRVGLWASGEAPQYRHLASDRGIVSAQAGQRRVGPASGAEDGTGAGGAAGAGFGPGKGAYKVPLQPGHVIHWPAHSGCVSTNRPHEQTMDAMIL